MKISRLFLPFLLAIAGCATQNPPAKINGEKDEKSLCMPISVKAIVENVAIDSSQRHKLKNWIVTVSIKEGALPYKKLYIYIHSPVQKLPGIDLSKDPSDPLYCASVIGKEYTITFK